MRVEKRQLSLISVLAGLLLAGGTSLFYFHGDEGGKEKRADNPGSEQISSEGNSLLIAGSDTGYVDAQACMSCHAQIYETYQNTGMGRAFFRPRPENTVEDWSVNNVFYHRASDRYYTMYERDGKYFQRRHQIGFDGSETNVVEKEIHFVLGSGNHVRSYLHKTPDGRLVQLPVAWYREKGGFWAMNPGYDRPNHFAFRRTIDHQCMSCHNAYPEIESGSDSFSREPIFNGKIPEGIDCQRCHGPGRDHIQAIQSPGATPQTIRASIVNPARLSRKRQLELCMQCHLETTSARLPPFISRYDRRFFSFRPGEELGDFILHFDHAPGSGYDDKFEIVNAVYRFRQSLCFQESNGSFICTTCHNPHDIPRGEEAIRHYVGVCQSCHSAALQKLIASNQHTNSSDCLGCHMPKRRTEDVVHVIMTDHYIQRFKPDRDLLAPLQEEQFYGREYRGEVVLYYPPDLPPSGETELYLAVAQIKDSANLQSGISHLEKAIEKYRPEQGEFYFALAEAYAESEQFDKAIRMYEQALHRQPNLWLAQHKLGIALSKSGQLPRAAEALQKAAEMGIEQATSLSDLGLVYRQQGKLEEAVRVLEKAVDLDPGQPQAYNNLGAALLEIGNPAGAKRAFRNAIRIYPHFAAPHNNLAKLLAAGGDFRQAEYHFEKAIQNNVNFAQAHYDYGLTLTQMEMYEKAQEQLEAAIRLEPNWAEAHNTLGEVLAIRGKIEEAIPHFRRALELEPTDYQAHFTLGNMLAIKGDLQGALPHFRKAAQSPDPFIRQGALDSIEKITGR